LSTWRTAFEDTNKSLTSQGLKHTKSNIKYNYPKEYHRLCSGFQLEDKNPAEEEGTIGFRK
jgi:hypothetical protein